MITPRHFHDQQLAERYLADQLSPQEQAELEEYYSDHPQVLRDLQAVAGIKVGLASLRACGELDRLTALRRTRWPLGLALAASLLLAAGGVSHWRRAQDRPVTLHAAATPPLTDLAGTLPIKASYDVQRTRSDVDVIIRKSATGGAVRLRLRDELVTPPAQYRLELHTILADDTRRLLTAVGGLMVDDTGSLNVYVDPTRLELGSYELRLFKDGAAAHGSALNDFVLDVVAEDALAVAPDSSR